MEQHQPTITALHPIPAVCMKPGAFLSFVSYIVSSRTFLSGGTIERKTLCRKLVRKPTRRCICRPPKKAATKSSIIRDFNLIT